MKIFKFIKSFFKWFFLFLIIINVLIVVSGNTYLYTTLQHTLFKGRLGPSPTEYKIFYNHEIKAGKEKPWALATQYNQLKLNENTRAELEKYKSLAYLIIKNDSILYEEYWDEGSKISVTNSFSMAKTFVSILVGIAIDEKKISSVDQPVSDFIDEFKTENKAKLTIRHLLTMSSGIDFDEDYLNPLAYPAKAYYGTDITKLTLQYKVKKEPGKIFEYLSGNTELLGLVLQKAVGKPISEYASEKLWIPLGASRNAYWSLDHENGMEKAYCCFNSNARDFARFGSLYLHHGNWYGNQLVSEDYVKQSIMPAPLLDENNKPNNKYGYSWWLLNYQGLDIFYARGILGQYVVVIPAKNLIVVRLGYKRSKEKINDHPKELYSYIDAALEMDEKK